MKFSSSASSYLSAFYLAGFYRAGFCLRWVTLLLVFSCAGYLQAQSSISSDASAGSQTSPEAISGVGGQDSFPSVTGAGDESGRGRSGFRHDKSSFSNNSAGSAEWNPFVNDAYQMGMRSSRFGRGGIGGHPANLESLFQMSSKLSQDLDKGFGAGNSGAWGSALGVLPKLNQLERNGLKLPVDSPFGKFQFSYRDQLGQGANALGGIGRGSAQATFNSTGLKDDMLHFSATAMYGGAGSGMGGSSFGSGGATGAGSGMFSAGSMNGAGIGSGGPGGFSAGSMHSSMGEANGGMRGMGGEGGHGRSAEPVPSVSLRLTFK
jgi:hypothetical protein